MATNITFSCSACKVIGCNSKDGKYPKQCVSLLLDEKEKAEIIALYNEDEINSKIALAAAEIEGLYYGQKTRVEETIEFIIRTGAKKVGIASCAGLLNETSLFANLLNKYNINYFAVGCKVGATDKSEIGIPGENKLNKGCDHESMCNPILQAELLNKQETDINIIIGLCVGHDMLFSKYSKAPVTTMIVKDRVLGHNPVAALYASTGAYSRFK